MLFHAIDDKQAVVRNTKTGVYKQVKLYEREGFVYAGVGGGFIRLMHEGRTSQPNMLWVGMEIVCRVEDGPMHGLVYGKERKAA